MRDESEPDVLLVGHSASIQKMLTQLVRQCGVSVGAFAAWGDCAGPLRRGCRLLVIDMDGDATSALQMVIETRQMRLQTPILILVEHGDIAAAVSVMKAGATDCLEKPTETEKLRSTISSLLGQGAPHHPNTGAVLTRTECLVLTHVLEGRTSREIAALLCRSHRTVEAHRRRIMHKLGASNVAGLVWRATMGFIGRR
jgi:FixJ family two-component response regulator